MNVEQIKGRVDFGIITIREDEFRATLQRFHPDDLVEGERQYSLSYIRTKSGENCLVVVVRAPEQGEGEAQNTARDLIEDLDPEWLVLVGIAGAVPAVEFTLGDVALATRLYDFSIEARIQNESAQYSMTGGPMHRLAQDFLASLPVYELQGVFQGWNDDNSIGMTRPSVMLQRKNFYGDNDWIRKTKTSLTTHFGKDKPSSLPRFTTGPTASSDRLIKDTDILKEWRRTARHIVNVEMELGGVYRAARRKNREYPILAVRGLSDVVGFKRDDNWTEYACHSAASFAHALIHSGKIPHDPTRKMRKPVVRKIQESQTDELSNLRLASSIVATDARVIISETALGGDVYLDDDLYVFRQAENKIIDELNVPSEPRRPIVVIGEAGRGKTSLLLHLFSTLSRADGWEPWLLKSTMLVNTLRSENLGTKLSSEVLTGAITQAHALGKRPLLLLDTVDLLLHDETSRDYLVGLVLKLQDSGCSIVMTTRPQEASRLYAFEFRIFTLLNYDEQELKEAIAKHVRRFYAHFLQADPVDHTKEILDSVARGLPLREVCENPLTLRMLFTIYAPSKIPKDINIFELYRQYWSHRVETDFRAGSLFPVANSVNAERSAEAVALAMLGEGRPETAKTPVQRFVEQMGSRKEDVDILISRGVVHYSTAGTISFFHQTFFEHSAARGLLRYLPTEAFAFIKARLNSKRDDLFIIPIYEQTLLLAEDADTVTKELAETAIIELLRDNSLAAVMSALYVYCHRRLVSTTLQEVTEKALLQGEEAVQIRFLELAPNIPTSRLPRLLEELDLIWYHSTNRTKDHLIALLKRLVPRDHRLVEDFFDRHDLINHGFNLPAPFNIARGLLDIVEAVSSFNPAWSWKRFIEICGASIPKTRGREIPIAVVNFIRENASLYDSKAIATRFETDTSGFMLDRARDFYELALAIGELWALEWTETGLSIDEILSEISRQSTGMPLVTRMRGLSLVLLSAPLDQVIAALSHFDKEKDHYKKSIWIDYILPGWLRGLDCDSVKTESVGYLQNYVKSRMVQEGNWGAKQPFVQAIRYATLSPDSFRLLIPTHNFTEPEPWLDQNQLAFLLGDGFVAGHPGAENALQFLKQDPGKYWHKISKAVAPSLIKRILESTEVMDAFFSIVTRTEDAVQIQRALEKLPIPGPSHFLSWHTVLANCCVKILHTSRTPQKRRYAIMIWDQLLARGARPIHELEELLSLMRSEADQRVRGYLLSIIGRSTAGMNYDLARVFEVLEVLACGLDLELRRRAMLALSQAVTDFPGDISEYALKAIEIAVSPPPDAERICSIRPIIERLVLRDADLAASMTQKLISGAANAKIGISGRHKMFGRLKFTTRLVVRRASHRARQGLLSIVPQLDRILGSLVTDAICHEALAELAPELDALLESKIAGEIKQIIIRYRYTQERSLGGRGWPELYQLLLSDRAITR